MKPLHYLILLLSLFTAARASAEFDTKAAAQKIDRFLNANLKKQALEPTPKLSDEQFVRRAHLSLIGRIPTLEERDEFVASTDEDKDSSLILELLANDAGYTAHHFQFWADLLRIPDQAGWGLEYRMWVKEQIAANTPYDEFARRLVNGHGLMFDNPAAGYYIRDTGMPLDNMSNTVRIFLGTRLECAQCHDHPFDKWTQMDYFRMAAFTFGFDHRGGNPHRSGIHQALKAEERAAYHEAVGTKGFPWIADEKGIEKTLAKPNSQKTLENLGLTADQFRERARRGVDAEQALAEHNEPIYGSIGGLYNATTYLQVRHLKETDLHLPHDYQYDDAKPGDLVPTGTMFGAEVPPQADPADRKKAYADWLTSPDNPRFTQVMVNRLWKRAFGIGLFEPVDDLTDYTAISQPELLSYLEELFRELDYDVRVFQSVLYQTDLFRREVFRGERTPGVPFHFEGPLMRRMSAEQIWDSVATLVLPDIDTYAPNQPRNLQRMAEKRATYHSLNGYPLQEVLPRIKAVGDLRRDLRKKQANYEKKISAAYEAGENDHAKKLTSELRDISRKFDRRSREIALVDVKDGKAVESMQMMGLGMTAGSGETKTRDWLKQIRGRKAPEGLSKEDRKQWDEAERESLQEFKQVAKDTARAIDLASPARTGHFLRVFGQSDREVIENATDNSSVPQALYLLNGPIGTAVHNSNSVLGSHLQSASTTQEKIDLIYRTMLSRNPTDRETARILRDYDSYGEEVMEDLIWALLNSRQFLFIQ